MPTRSHLAAAFLLICAGAASHAAAQAETAKPATVAAQPTAGVVDPAAKKIIDQMRDAARAVKDVSYSIMAKSDRENDTRPKRADVAFRFTADPTSGMIPVDLYRVTMLDDASKPVVGWAGTPDTVQKIDHAKKKLLSLDLKGEDAMPAGEVWAVLPNWILQEKSTGDQMAISSATVLPSAEFGGVKCDVVRYVRERVIELPPEEGAGEAKKDAAPAKMILTSTRHIGQDDHLPRRIETVASFENMPADSGAEGWNLLMEITNLRVNADLGAKEILWTAPEGYEAAAGNEKEIGVQIGEPEAPELAFKAGDTAPDFTLTDTAGKQWTMTSLKGKVVLLDFWATWCGPCKAAMPSIQSLHDKFKGRPVEIMGVNVWERGKKADTAGAEYMKSKDFSYTCLVKGEDLAKAYNVSGIPTMVLIDADGKVLHTAVGFGPGEEEHLAELIEKELTKKN